MQSGNDRVTCVRNEKGLGITDIVLETKRVKNYSDFAKLAHLIQHGLQESKEANDLSYIKSEFQPPPSLAKSPERRRLSPET